MSAMWRDVGTFIDIFIVALILYRILVVLVGTRAIQLLKGVLMLVLFSVAASMLHLRLVSWLIGQILWALSFAIPIVFQPELRKMLEEIGRGNLWQRQLPRDVAEQRVRQVHAALSYMKINRIGALLVLQQKTGLGEYTKTGGRLDAVVTQDLIVTIFWEGTPLHDGALIMDRHSLIAGGCILPVSDDPDIARMYGTRHRAALGLSDVSDAVVLVVSEERGEISLAFKGRLSRNLKEEKVERLLYHYFLQEPKYRTWRDRLQSFLSLFWEKSQGERREQH